MREVYLIRHGESEANAAEFLDISSDTYIFDAELTTKGKMQAKTASNELNHIEFDLIVSSPLSRALQTYEIIFSRRGIKLDINPINESIGNLFIFIGLLNFRLILGLVYLNLILHKFIGLSAHKKLIIY